MQLPELKARAPVAPGSEKAQMRSGAMNRSTPTNHQPRRPLS